MKIRTILAIICMSLITVSYANLRLQLTQGISAAVPIAIVPFAGQSNSTNDPNNVASTVQNDLRNSGRFTVMENGKIQQTPSTPAGIDFSYWKQTGNEYMVIGNVQPSGYDSYKVSFSLVNVFGQKGQNAENPVVFNKVYTVNRNQLRAAAHKISDEVYKQITGIPGIFSTRVAYVVVQGDRKTSAKYILAVADADGFNPRPLLVSSEPIMSPSWAPNGNQIAYVSFANQRASVYVVNVASGQQRLISEFPGMNNAPAWSPDGSQLALVLSKSGAPKIYTYSLGSGSLRQLTTGDSIDTEPNWSPDGKSIVFTSDRGGGPQIYRLSLAGGNIQRVTFDGDYNATPRFTDSGQSLVILHRENGGYNIAVQDLVSGGLSTITRDGYNSSPSVAPNGQMVIYANNRNQKGTLGIVSIDGKIQLVLPAPEGTVEEPAWSPFLG